MAKPKKCSICKLDFNAKDNIISYEIGNIKKIKKYAHQSCFEQAKIKRQFYNQLAELLEIPYVDNITKKIINNIANRGYGFDVLLHALEIKKDVIRKNNDKHISYILAIIQNQMVYSYKELERQKKKDQMQMELQKVREGEVETLVFKTINRSKNNIISSNDINEL